MSNSGCTDSEEPTFGQILLWSQTPNRFTGMETRYRLIGLEIVGTQLSVQGLGCNTEKNSGLAPMPVHFVQGGDNLFFFTFCQTERGVCDRSLGRRDLDHGFLSIINFDW